MTRLIEAPRALGQPDLYPVFRIGPPRTRIDNRSVRMNPVLPPINGFPGPRILEQEPAGSLDSRDRKPESPRGLRQTTGRHISARDDG